MTTASDIVEWLVHVYISCHGIRASRLEAKALGSRSDHPNASTPKKKLLKGPKARYIDVNPKMPLKYIRCPTATLT